jgi:hypothetical protein
MTPYDEHKALGHKTSIHASGDGFSTIETCDTCGARFLFQPWTNYPHTMRPLVMVGGIQCTQEYTEAIDGIAYELYNEPVFNGGVIRTYDREAGETVQIKIFKTYHEAKRYYFDLTQLVRNL